MALTPALGLNVKLWGSLFDPLPQNMNRAGSALSIIYTHSFSISCLSALVAVTCPDTNGGRLGENIYQCYRRSPLQLCAITFSPFGTWSTDTALILIIATILYCMRVGRVVSVNSLSLKEPLSCASSAANESVSYCRSYTQCFNALKQKKLISSRPSGRWTLTSDLRLGLYPAACSAWILHHTATAHFMFYILRAHLHTPTQNVHFSILTLWLLVLYPWTLTIIAIHFTLAL